jgi:hypothetical protein
MDRTRATLLADACQAAIERVEMKADAMDPADLFAEVGEALYWVSALADQEFKKGDDLPELLSGVIWARDRVTHGEITWELVCLPPRALVGPGGGQVGPEGGLVGPGGNHWIDADRISIGSDGRKTRGLRKNYKTHIEGGDVVRILFGALILARDGVGPTSAST